MNNHERKMISDAFAKISDILKELAENIGTSTEQQELFDIPDENMVPPMDSIPEKQKRNTLKNGVSVQWSDGKTLECNTVKKLYEICSGTELAHGKSCPFLNKHVKMTMQENVRNLKNTVNEFLLLNGVTLRAVKVIRFGINGERYES